MGGKPMNKDENDFWIYANGDCICEKCGKEYRKHPYSQKDVSYDGTLYMHVLCSGVRVKL
jgi:hypothetical protein